ncbi:acyltransferase family protein [Microbacterium oryzae]|uniref:acyltransferase family protein n=1 Tax=Microbacterium oryzae TaxID=743009 RepID=UPI0025AF24D8|nr:acyltransferase family protein [Microbacterium oryzae]MDN3310446.1 acyltransferase family protein [Microbacterium oryzae]
MATSATERLNRQTAKPPVRRGQRRDIQGLRALAVLAVVLNHLAPRILPGGYVGVDVFFVISGFLITGLLLREYEKSGHISFRKFYARRAKRLVPAATLAIVVTVIASHLLLPAIRARSVQWDGLWSFIFVQNWNLAASSTNYFDENSGTSPLQHFWSLSVEEQFYLVWPWLLLLLLHLLARGNGDGNRARSARRVAGTAIGAIILLSFSWALVQSVVAPSPAYFSTLTRAWELGLGAAIAVCASRLTRLPMASRVVLLYSGLAAIAVSLWSLNAATTWPAPWALLPTLGAAAVIVSGVGEESRFDPFLRNRLAVWVGDISYSLYLWHFPVIVLGGALYPNAGRKVDVALLALAFALSACAYYLVEEPLHKSPWLMPRATSSSWADWLHERHGRLIRAGLGSLLTAVAIIAAVAMVPVRNPVDEIPLEALTSPDANPAVVAGLSLEAWPDDLTPVVGSPRSEKYVTAWSVDKCLAQGMTPAETFAELSRRCVYGDPQGTKTVVVVGDSVAISWTTALDDALRTEGWRIVNLTAEMCPASDVEIVRDTGTLYPGCGDFRDLAQRYVAETSPDLVILSETSTSVARLADGAEGDAAIGELAQGMKSSIATMSASGADVVLISSIPRTRSMGDCFDESAGPAACTFVAGGQSHLGALEQAAAETGAALIDSRGYFCVENVCPPAIAGMLARPDGAHPSDAYARSIGPALWSEIEEALG